MLHYKIESTRKTSNTFHFDDSFITNLEGSRSLPFVAVHQASGLQYCNAVVVIIEYFQAVVESYFEIQFRG